MKPNSAWLLWENVNLDLGYLTVRHQLQKIDHELRLVEPKTDKSRRTIVLPPSIVESLRAHRERQDAERRDADGAWKDGGFVFTHTDGSPLDARHAIHHFHRALAAAGIPRRRFHDLRHSCATLLLIQGVSPRVVMDLLGHSEIAMAMNTYSHMVPELRREAADRMEAILNRVSSD